jgi:hypothetical protein
MVQNNYIIIIMYQIMYQMESNWRYMGLNRF